MTQNMYKGGFSAFVSTGFFFNRRRPPTRSSLSLTSSSSSPPQQRVSESLSRKKNDPSLIEPSQSAKLRHSEFWASLIKRSRAAGPSSSLVFLSLRSVHTCAEQNLNFSSADFFSSLSLSEEQSRQSSLIRVIVDTLEKSRNDFSEVLVTQWNEKKRSSVVVGKS